MSLALKASKAASGAASGGAFISRSQFMGDPGLFGFLGKTIGGIAKRVFGSTPLGMGAAAISGAIAGRAGQDIGGAGPGGNLFQSQEQILFPPTVFEPTPGIGGKLERLFPGGKSGFQEVSAEPPKGFHRNKAAYFLKDGTFVPKGSRFVKDRRRNPLNPKAASAAISRLESSQKAIRRIDRVKIKCKKHHHVNCKIC